MNFMTENQKKFIKKLLKEKFKISGKLENEILGIELNNNSESDNFKKFIRINRQGYLDGNQINKTQASGLIESLLDQLNELFEKDKFGSEQTYIKIIRI